MGIDHLDTVQAVADGDRAGRFYWRWFKLRQTKVQLSPGARLERIHAQLASVDQGWACRRRHHDRAG
jgi:hypothetical protein